MYRSCGITAAASAYLIGADIVMHAVTEVQHTPLSIALLNDLAQCLNAGISADSHTILLLARPAMPHAICKQHVHATYVADKLTAVCVLSGHKLIRRICTASHVYGLHAYPTYSLTEVSCMMQTQKPAYALLHAVSSRHTC